MRTQSWEKRFRKFCVITRDSNGDRDTPAGGDTMIFRLAIDFALTWRYSWQVEKGWTNASPLHPIPFVIVEDPRP